MLVEDSPFHVVTSSLPSPQKPIGFLSPITFFLFPFCSADQIRGKSLRLIQGTDISPSLTYANTFKYTFLVKRNLLEHAAQNHLQLNASLPSLSWHLISHLFPDTTLVTNYNLLAPLSTQDCYLNSSIKWQTPAFTPTKRWRDPVLCLSTTDFPERTHTSGTEQSPHNSGLISPRHVLQIPQGSKIDFGGGSWGA